MSVVTSCLDFDNEFVILLCNRHFILNSADLVGNILCSASHRDRKYLLLMLNFKPLPYT